jgi:hypothetical protein
VNGKSSIVVHSCSLALPRASGLIIFKDRETQKQFQGLTDASTLIAAMKAAE